MSRESFTPAPPPNSLEEIPEYVGREIVRLAAAVVLEPDKWVIREISNTSTGILHADDALGGFVRINHSASCAVFLASSDLAPWGLGDQVSLVQWGSGASRLTASAGVTIRTPETKSFEKQYAAVTCIYINKDEWLIAGQLTPV